MRTDPQMTRESLVNFYQEDYRVLYGGEERATDDFFKQQLIRGEHVIQFTREWFSASSPEQLVFDIGCGAGGLLMPFHEAGCRAIGCDLGREYLEYGRAKGLIMEHGDSEVLSHYGKADLIMLNHVIEHFKNPEKEIRRIAELLTDDGLIYVELPGVLSIKETYGDLLLFLQNA
ncbi:MAG: class I SAM-dependent methyltransferase, partial [Desulfuromusa sp.]|nr:class I SAM-dependent methyltransferase [Desulfuromusa sp.]